MFIEGGGCDGAIMTLNKIYTPFISLLPILKATGRILDKILADRFTYSCIDIYVYTNIFRGRPNISVGQPILVYRNITQPKHIVFYF